MIIRSEHRKVGGLAAHLMRTDTNKEVRIEEAHLRDSPTDVSDAFALFKILARTNARCRNDFVHFKISPAKELTAAELAQVWAIIEEEHAIPVTTPRHVVRHVKGDRANHFHGNYALVDPDTGRAIDSSANYLKDEIASRRLEIMFGEPIVSGPRDKQVIEALEKRGLLVEAQLIAAASKTLQRGDRHNDRDRRQAARLEIDDKGLSQFVNAVWKAFHMPGDFEKSLLEYGLALAQGDKVIMVVDGRSTFAKPLHRTINIAAKAFGSDIRLRAGDTARMFLDLPPLAVQKRNLTKAAVEAADEGLAREIRAWRVEAELDHDDREIADARERQRLLETEREARSREFRDTLADRRRRIRAAYEERKVLRKRRVDRAFVHVASQAARRCAVRPSSPWQAACL